jgi:hypothetical protein
METVIGQAVKVTLEGMMGVLQDQQDLQDHQQDQQLDPKVVAKLTSRLQRLGVLDSPATDQSSTATTTTATSTTATSTTATSTSDANAPTVSPPIAASSQSRPQWQKAQSTQSPPVGVAMQTTPRVPLPRRVGSPTSDAPPSSSSTSPGPSDAQPPVAIHQPPVGAPQPQSATTVQPTGGLAASSQSQLRRGVRFVGRPTLDVPPSSGSTSLAPPSSGSTSLSPSDNAQPPVAPPVGAPPPQSATTVQPTQAQIEKAAQLFVGQGRTRPKLLPAWQSPSSGRVLGPGPGDAQPSVAMHTTQIAPPLSSSTSRGPGDAQPPVAIPQTPVGPQPAPAQVSTTVQATEAEVQRAYQFLYAKEQQGINTTFENELAWVRANPLQ